MGQVWGRERRVRRTEGGGKGEESEEDRGRWEGRVRRTEGIEGEERKRECGERRKDVEEEEEEGVINLWPVGCSR
jgi:hypothetical protein